MNIKNYFRYILLTGSVLLFCLFACTERIDINTEASPPRLVIYGYITTDTTQHAIRITRSTGYFVSTKPQGISNASVSISCENGVFELAESLEEPGLYLTSPDVYGIEGKTYTLHISLDFDGDGDREAYEASSYLPFSATLDSVAIEPFPLFDNFLQVLIWGDLPEESSHNFSFHLFRNDVLMNDSLQGFMIVQDSYIVNSKIIALPIFQLNQERDRYVLSSGDTLTVQVESFTAEYATFLNDAFMEWLGSPPLFGGPPANVGTNIRSLSPNPKTEISGFFSAYSKHSNFMIYE